MSHKIILLLFLSAWGIKGVAQEDCDENIRLAQVYLNRGELQKIPELLTPCAESKKNRAPKRIAALEILMETYLFLKEDRKAGDMYKKLLTLNPSYQYRRKTNFPELEYLSSRYKAHPLFRIGAFGGLNWLRISDAEQFYPEGLVVREEDYNSEWGYHTGVSLGFSPFNRPFNFRLEAIYSRSSFIYSGTYENALTFNLPGERGLANFEFLEEHTWLGFPLTFNYHFSFGKNKRNVKPFSFYLFGGAGYYYLLDAKMNNLSITFPELELFIIRGEVDLFEEPPLRTRWNFAWLAGCGLEARVDKLFIFTDIRYSVLLNSIAKEENRGQNFNLTSFNYLDNTMEVGLPSLTLGVIVPFYKAGEIK